MMLDQPLYPTLLDDVNMKTRSTILVLQSDSTLWQIYNITVTVQCINAEKEKSHRNSQMSCILLKCSYTKINHFNHITQGVAAGYIERYVK